MGHHEVVFKYGSKNQQVRVHSQTALWRTPQRLGPQLHNEHIRTCLLPIAEILTKRQFPLRGRLPGLLGKREGKLLTQGPRRLAGSAPHKR